MNGTQGIEKVYEQHGAAMAEAQLLENYLRMAHSILVDPADCAAGKPPALGHRSLASLINELGDSLPVRDRFDEARKRRNWLAHESFLDNANDAQSESGRAQVIEKLGETGDLFYELWGCVDTALERWLHKPSPTREDLIVALEESAPNA